MAVPDSEQAKCEKCGSPADNYVMGTKQWFCLECALDLPKGSIPIRERCSL